MGAASGKNLVDSCQVGTPLRFDSNVTSRHGVTGIRLYTDEAGRSSALRVGVLKRRRLLALPCLRVRQKHGIVVALRRGTRMSGAPPMNGMFWKCSGSTNGPASRIRMRRLRVVSAMKRCSATTDPNVRPPMIMTSKSRVLPPTD
jgi:hypothetical protein